MMNYLGQENEQSVVTNEYDYSNIIANAEWITYLVNYCEQVYNNIKKISDEEEERNKPYKSEYKEYSYKLEYSFGLEVYIKDKSYKSITCKSLDTFKSAVLNGNLNDIDSMEIKLSLDFKRGKGDNLERHENIFVISFKPYDIKFSRKSNHNDSNMNQIEQQINEIMGKFPIANTIFCTK